MPDDQGKLTQEEKNAASAKIIAKAPNLTCSACHTQKWAIQDHIVTPITFSGNFNLGGFAYPQVALVCANCMHTIFFSAVALGLFPKTGETDAGK